MPRRRAHVLEAVPHAVLAVVVVALCAACPPGGGIASEGAHYVLDAVPLSVVAGTNAKFWSGEPVLVGSRACTAIACTDAACFDAQGTSLFQPSCVDTVADGALVDDSDGCVTFGSVGAGHLALTPNGACTVPLVDDRFTVAVVDGADLTARFQPPIEQLVLHPPDTFPILHDDALPPAFGASRDRLRAASGGLVWLGADLEETDGTRVAFESGSFGLVGAEGKRRVAHLDENVGAAVADAPGSAAVVLGPYRAATLDVVSVDDVAAVTIVPFYGLPTRATDERAPLGALAVVTDVTGAVLDGAPVAWSIDASLVVRPLAAALFPHNAPSAGDLWALVADCHATTPALRTATITATVGAHSATATYAWTAPHVAPADTNAGCPPVVVAPPPPRPAGCACRSAGSPADGAALVAVAAIFGARARRRRERQRASERRAYNLI